MNNKKFYAGFWVRIFAGLLDLVFLAPIFLLLVYFFSDGDYQMLQIGDSFRSYSYSGSTSQVTILDYLTYAISILYLVHFLSSKTQATFGKRIMGIYVGNPDGSRLSSVRALVRAIASMLTATTIGLGFLLVIFTKEKTALHDLICNTRVFHGRKNGS
jgi:uncharacterized RDD family membrane protein YckC